MRLSTKRFWKKITWIIESGSRNVIAPTEILPTQQGYFSSLASSALLRRSVVPPSFRAYPKTPLMACKRKFLIYAALPKESRLRAEALLRAKARSSTMLLFHRLA